MHTCKRQASQVSQSLPIWACGFRKWASLFWPRFQEHLWVLRVWMDMGLKL